MHAAMQNYFDVRTANATGATVEQVKTCNAYERMADEHVPAWWRSDGDNGRAFAVEIEGDIVRIAVWIEESFYEGVVRKDGTVKWG